MTRQEMKDLLQRIIPESSCGVEDFVITGEDVEAFLEEVESEDCHASINVFRSLSEEQRQNLLLFAAIGLSVYFQKTYEQIEDDCPDEVEH